jgi:hypothetical protein
MRATDGTWRSYLLRRGVARGEIDTLLQASTLLVLLLGLFLLSRRAAGALTSTPPVPWLLLTAFGLFTWALAVRKLSRTHSFWTWLAVVNVVVFAIACSFPGNRAADWLIWSATIVALFVSDRVPSSVRPWGQPRTTARLDQAEGEESGDEQILQRLTRGRTAEGRDFVRGELSAPFSVGERQTTLYVGFCPPFLRQPEVEAHIADDTDGSIKLVQVLHNGARLEVRLAAPAAEAECVAVEVFATEAIDA